MYTCKECGAGYFFCSSTPCENETNTPLTAKYNFLDEMETELYDVEREMWGNPNRGGTFGDRLERVEVELDGCHEMMVVPEASKTLLWVRLTRVRKMLGDDAAADVSRGPPDSGWSLGLGTHPPSPHSSLQE